MNLLFGELPEAISNTVEIAGRCNVELEFGKYFFISLPYPRATTRTPIWRSFAIRAPAGYTANWVRKSGSVWALNWELSSRWAILPTS